MRKRSPDQAPADTPGGSDDVATDISATQAKPNRARGKRALPADLERIKVRHELAYAARHCPHDGTELTVIREQTSEQLDIVPATVRVLLHVQLKYACPCCREHVVTAPKPRSAVPGPQVSPGLLAHVAVSRYLDHRTLSR
jgi:transposase